MPLRSEWAIGREGFTLDTIIGLLKNTAFNPYVSIPLWLAAKYTVKGQQLALERPDLANWVRRFAILSALQKVKNTFDQGVQNNWTNDKYDWSKEIVVVTGGSDGIGARVVQMLAERGIKVVILDIQPPKFGTTKNVYYFQCDLASPSAIRYIASGVVQNVGNPTILINNAGFARGNTILSASEMDIDLTFRINTISHYHLAQAFVPDMIKNNHGMVITVASLAAYLTSPGLVDYSASKSAALAFHEGLQGELATLLKADKVRTVAVCQGYTRTALFEGFDKGDRFVNYALDPDTVAEAIVRAALRGQSDMIILPKGNMGATSIRSWPMWLQGHMRKRLVKLMKGWNGRQVAQPTEKTVKEGGNTQPPAVESSTVLVERAVNGEQ